MAQRLIDRYRGVIANREEVLRGDFRTLDTIEENLNAYQVDIQGDYDLAPS